MERERIKLERLEDKHKKENEEQSESGVTDKEEIEIKREELQGLTNQLETGQPDQKHVFIVIFQVR